MSSNKAIIERLRQLNSVLVQTIADAENDKNPGFFKESIKHQAIQLFETAQMLTATENTVQTEVKAPVEIKIIRQEAVEAPKTQPVVAEEPKVVVPAEEPPKSAPPVENVAEIKVEAPRQKEIKPAVEPVKPLQPSKKTFTPPPPPPSLNDKLDDEEDDETVNDKIAKGQKPVINVADKLKDTPIRDLAKSIAISKKFEFINDLFDGNSEAYKSCLSAIENSGSYENATSHIESVVMKSFNWDDNELLAAEFFALVKRRFL